MREWIRLTPGDDIDAAYCREMDVGFWEVVWYVGRHPRPLVEGIGDLSSAELAAIPPVAALVGASRPFALLEATTEPRWAGDRVLCQRDNVQLTVDDVRRAVAALRALGVEVDS